mmetsp:Transcript_7063/g.20476  ORF Transcript_7063/g.20476 Transcript_7063/m.20476 type:complete len:97 (-) Transcript_7063:273-563(-)
MDQVDLTSLQIYCMGDSYGLYRAGGLDSCPNIVRYYDSFNTTGRTVQIMEYIEGQPRHTHAHTEKGRWRGYHCTCRHVCVLVLCVQAESCVSCRAW